MNLPKTLLRVQKLREHRSLIAMQHVRSTRDALAAAEQEAARADHELGARQAALQRSERSAHALTANGSSGADFEQFMAHARLALGHVRLQRVEVASAHETTQRAQRGLEAAREAHAMARKAEEKIDRFRQQAQQHQRTAAGVLEADVLEETAGLLRSAGMKARALRGLRE